MLLQWLQQTALLQKWTGILKGVSTTKMCDIFSLCIYEVKSSLKRRGAQSERRKLKLKESTPTRHKEHQFLLEVLVN